MRGQFVINVVSSIVLALNPVFVPTASAAPAEKSATAAPPLIDTRVTANAALPDWFTRPATEAAPAAVSSPLPAWFTAPSDQAAPLPAKVAPVKAAATSALPAWFTAPAAAPLPMPPSAPLNSPLRAPIANLFTYILTPTNSVSVGNLDGDTYHIYVSNMMGVTNAYTLNVTASLPNGFSLVPDSSQWTFRAADMSQHSISHTVFITDNVITWEPTTPLNLLMGEYTYISFKLATSCGVQSAQLLSAFANYSDIEGPGTTASYVNVTTGRGNLVVEQTPSLQDARYGDMVTWTIKARNTGLGNVYSATVEALPDASFTNVNYGSLPFTIGQLAPNEFRSYTVSARVNACSPLRNTAAAYWSCGNVDSTATSTAPVSTSASVRFLLEVPNVSLAVTPNPVRVPYCTNTTPVTVTVNNTGGPALDLILRSNLNSLGASANIVSGSPFTYDSVTGIFSYTGGTPVGLLNRSTSTTLTFNVNQTAACNASNGLLSFAPSFADACDVPFDLPTRNTTYQYGNDAPTLIVTSTAPNSTYAGEQVVFTVLLDATNTQNLADAIYITDVVPSVFSVTAASVTTGTLSPIGQTLIWTVSPGGSPVSAILLITTTASSGVNQCLSFASSTNVVTATAPVNCAGCNPLISTASSTVVGQNVPGTQYAKTTSGSSEVCSDISFTNHYSLSQVTWAGTFFTESLGTGSLVTSLNYISGSLQVVVNGVDRTADVTIAQTAPRLVLDFSGMGTPTETVDFTITYQARVPAAALGGSVYRTYFDWSQLTVGGTVGDESCKADRTFYQGLYLTIYRGDLNVSLSPASADACAITPVVLTVSGGRADRVTGNVVVTFTAPADEFASLNVTGFGGAFAGNPVVTTTAGNVITWTFANPISSNGTVNLTIKRSCSSSGTWRANVSFTDQCGVTYTNSTANTPTTNNPNLVLFLTPSRYNLTANVARWRIYLTNNGSGVGTNVLVTDTLGAGLQFITYTTSDPTGIIMQQTGNQITWTVATLDPAEQRWIDVSAQAIGCSNLTSVVTATLGCNGSTCANQTKSVDFLTFSASLLTNNGQTADLPLCGVGTVVLTTKNTSGGGSAIYNLTLSETLTNLTYVAGSAVVKVFDDLGQLVTSTTAFQPITSTPYVTSTLLVWSHEAAPPGLLDAVSAGYVVSVTFSVATDCAATSNNGVSAKVSAYSACSQFFQRTENAVTLKVADPIFLFDKLGRGPTQASFSPIAVAEPGETVVWQLHVRNSALGYQAQNVWLTDTLPANFVYGSASLAPTNVSGGVISWDLGDLPADGVDRYYHITGTVSAGSCALGTTNQAILEYGCDNGCRLSIPIASATLRSQPSMTLLQTPAALSECGGVITLTVQNLGTTAYTFTLTDTLPAGLIFSETISSSTAYSTAPTLGDTTLAWTFAALPPGDTQIVFVAKNATGACFAANGANQLAATYTDACGSPPNTTIFTPTLDALTSNLVVAVSPGAQVITPGQTISWTITVNNTGDGAANHVVITDVVGSGFNALVASDGSNGQAPSIIGNQITYAFPTLDADATWTAIITGTSIPGTQLSYNNVLTASKRCGDGCSQTRTATGFTSPSDRLIKLADPQPNVRVGEPVTYSLSTSFWGEGHIYNAIIISDILPLLNSVAAISVTGAAVTSTNAANTWIAGALTGDTITFTTATGDVLGQDIVTAFVYGVVADTAEAADGRTFMNTGLLTYSDLGQSYRLVATTTQTIIEPVLTLSKAVDTSTGSAINLDGNALITYTIRVTNSGTAPAHSVRLTDAIPSGISVTAQFGGDAGSGPVVGANDLTWLINSIGNTAPDNVIELIYTARISQALANTTLINVVTGTYRSVPETWPQSRRYGPLTDTRSLSTDDVSVNKLAAPTTLRLGDVTTHSLVFTVPAGLIGLGGGTSDLIDTLPVGLEFVTDTETLTWSPAEVTVITTSRAINSAGSQQQVTWYFDAITSTLDQPTVITLTLQAQATGKQINTGDTVFAPPSAVFTPTNTVALWQRGVFVGSSTAQNRVIQPVLSINKTVTPTVNSFVGSGDLLSYTLVVANSSYGPAYNIVISDVLPADVIYDSSLIDNGLFDQQPTFGDTGTIVWHVAALDGTEVATSPRFTITVYAHVDPNIGANLTLNNSASLPYYDSEPGPGVTTALGTVQRTYSDGSSSAALRTVNGGLAKAVTFSPGPTATLGTLITYTLIVPDQPISATLYNVQITDTIDPRMTVVEVITGNGTSGLFTTTDQLITATFTSVPSYTQAYVTVTARVAAELGAVTGDVLTNAAAMLHADGAVTTSNVVSTTIGEPALSLAKSVATSTGATTNLDGNALITYTLRVTNSGTSPAYSIRLTDAIPSGISVTAQFGGDAGSGPVVGANNLTWLINSIGNIAPDNVIELTYTARISQALANTSLINAVQATYWSLTETVPQARSYGPLTDSETLSTSNVTMNKLAAPYTLRVGDVTTYSLVFTVPAGLIGLGSGSSTLIDTLPTGLEFVTDTETLTWSPAEVTVITTSRTTNETGTQQLVTWYFDAITSTLDQPTVVTLTLQAQATGKQINTGGSVFSPSSAVFTPTNLVSLTQRGAFVASSTASNRIIQPVLSINKTVTPTANSYVGSGQSITYTLVVTNSSNGPAYDIVISDVLPAGVIYVGSSIDENSAFDVSPAVSATGTITWQVAAITGTDFVASPRFTLTVSALVTPDIGANLTLNNSASIPYYDSEPGPGVTTTLGVLQRTYSDGSSSAALRTVNGGITKTVTFSPPPTATLGTLITYTLSVPQAPISATLYTVQITDTINPSLTIVITETANGVGGLITQTGQLITATFTSVPSYTQAYVTITARIDAALNARTGTIISNTAYLTHSAATALTNTQPVSTLVGEPTLTMTKQVASSAGNVTAVDGLQTLTYTIRITNTGSSPAYDVSITDVVPIGISVTAQLGGDSQGGPVQGPNPLMWMVNTITNVAPNNYTILTYTARISGAAASGVSGVRLTNTVTSTWTSLLGEVPGERSYGPITATAVITTARPGLIKSVSPTSNNTTNQLKVGDVVTYSLVVTVPPRLIVWWPFLYDDLPIGVRYITPSLSMTGTLPMASDPFASAATYASSPNGVLGATSTGNPRVGQTEATAAGESIEWWLKSLDNSQSDVTGYLTVTLQAQLTGISRNGVAQWPDALALATLTNYAYLYWNVENQGAYVTNTLTQTVSANVNSYALQPLLHLNKTYTTPTTCSATVLEDAFNRASTTPPTGWGAVAGTWNLNALGYANQSVSTNPAILTKTGFTASDFSFSAMLFANDNASSRGLIFGYVNSTNYYLFRIRQGDGGTNIQLQKMQSGTFITYTSITTITPVSNVWNHLEVRAENKRLRGYLDGVPAFDYTDPTFSGGSIGFYANACSANNCRYDDVFVTNLDTASCLVNASDLVTYTVTITNHGATPAFDLVISDVLPAELTYVSSALISAPTGTALDVVPQPGATGTITWGVNYLSGTNPSTLVYGNMRTLQLQIVARVTDTVSANARFSNQAFLPYYDTQAGGGPTGSTVLSNDADQRTYVGGSHSAGLQTPDGGITKTYAFDSPPTVTLGSLVTYTLKVPTSAISATLYGVQITDTIHPSMTIVPSGVFVSGGSGSVVVSDSQRVTATFASIVSNTFAYVTITARVMDNLRGYAGYVLTNTAYLSHSTASTITNTGIISTPIGEPALSIDKAVATSTGSTTNLDGSASITYTIRVTNSGTSPAYTIRLTDAVPSGISVTEQFGGDVQGGPVVGANNLTWLINTISNTAPNNVAIVTYTARITQALANTSLINIVQATYWSLTDTLPGVRSYGPISSNRTLNTGNLTINKLAAPATLRVGDVTTYSLVFTVPAGLIGMGSGTSTLIDTLPTGLEFVTDTETLTWSPAEVTVITTSRTTNETGAQQLVTWNFDAITSTLDQPTVVTLTLQAQATGQQINTGDIVFTPPSSVFAPTNLVSLTQRGSFVASSIAQNRLIQPVLTINKTVTPTVNSFVGSGDLISYTLVVANSSNGPAYNIVISDVLPVGVIYDSSTIDNGTFDQQPSSGDTGTLVWHVAALDGTDVAPSPRFTVTVYAHVHPDIGANLTLNNSAALPYYDSEPGPGVTTALGTLQRAYSAGSSSAALHTVDSGLAKAVTFSPPPTATLGTLVTYTLSVPPTPLNVTLYDVQITDTLHPSMTLVGVDTLGLYTVTGQLITTTFTSVPSYTQAYVTITARVMDNLRGYAGYALTNTAYLSHSAASAITRTAVVTTLLGEPSLAIGKSSEPAANSSVGAGQTVTYTVLITNANTSIGSPAYDLIFTDTLPLWMRAFDPNLSAITIDGTPVSASDYVTNYVAATGQFSIGFASTVSVPVGSVLRIQYAAFVEATVPSGLALTNQAQVIWTSLAGDVIGERAYGPLNTSVTLNTLTPDLSKQVTPGYAAPGDLITYTLTAPASPISATLYNVVITDAFDARTTVIDLTRSGGTGDLVTQTASLITATFASVPSYTQALVTVTVRVPATLGAVAGDLFFNEATLSDNLNHSHSNSTTVTVTEPSLTLVKASNPINGSLVGASDLITYSITITNRNSLTTSAAHDVVITDMLPLHLRGAEPTIIAITLNGTPIDPADYTTGFNSSTGVYTIGLASNINLPVNGMLFVQYAATVENTVPPNYALINVAQAAYDSQAGAVTGERAYVTNLGTTTLHTRLPGISKSVSPSTATLGDLITYTLMVPASPVSVTIYDAAITDTLNASTVIETVTAPGATSGWSGQVVTANFATIPAFSMAYVTITARLLSSSNRVAGNTFTNQATLSHTAGITTSNITQVRVIEPSLTLAKSSNPISSSLINAGSLVTYTVNLTNATGVNVSAAHDLLITDTLPQYLRGAQPTLITATLDGNPINAGNYAISWDVASGVYTAAFDSSINLLPNSTLLIQYAAIVEDSVPLIATLINRAQAAYSSLAGSITGERAYTTNVATTTLHTNLQADLSKAVTPSTATLGDIITYVVRVPATPIAATLYNVVITDAVHVSTTVESTSVDGGTNGQSTFVGQSVTATFDSVPALTQATLTITARLQSSSGAIAGNTLTNHAFLSHSSGLTHSNQTTVTVIEPSLSLIKASNPISDNFVGAGDIITYSITLTNRNTLTTSAAHDVIVTDTLPLHVRGAQPTIITVTLNGTPIDPGDYTTGFNSGTGVYTIGLASNVNLPVNGMVFIQYAAIVENTVPPGYTLINSAQAAYDSQAEVVTGERSYVTNLGTTTLQTTQPGISKSASSSTATLGDLLTYTLRVPADSLAAMLYNATITDTLNVSTTFVAITASGGSGLTTGHSGQIITANFATIPAGTQALVTITVRLPASLSAIAGSTILNQATLSHSTGVTQSNSTAFTVTEPALTLVKASNPISGSLVSAGDIITYAVTIANRNTLTTSAAHDVTLTDTLPLYLRGAQPTWITATLDGTPINAANYAISWDAASGVYTVAFDSSINLAPNSVLVIQYAATVEDSVPLVATLINLARATYSSLPTVVTEERSYATNLATTTLHVNLQPGLNKAVTPSTATLGDLVTYTLRVPATPIAATLYNATLTDTLNVSTTYVAIATSGGSGPTTGNSGQVVTAHFATISAGTQAYVTITARLLSSSGAVAGNTITNQATLSHSSGITHSNTTSFRVIEPALSIAKSSTPSAGSTVGAGDSVQYSLFITNATGLDVSSAHDLVITDTLPLYVRTTPPGSMVVTINSVPSVDYATTYDTASGVFTLTLGATVSLNAGETLRVDYLATIDNTVPAATALINQAHVSWSSLAGSITGKRDYGPISATTTLYGPQPTLGKVAAPPMVSLGSTVVFTLSVPGTPLAAVLNNVAVTDTLNSRLRVDAVSANAAFNGQVVTATFTSIASFAQETIVITATVLNLPTTTNGTSITNVAALNYANNPGGPVLSPIVTLDVHEPNVTLAKSVSTSRSPVGAGDLVTYTLTLNNTGNWPAHDLIITDALPSELAFVATTAINVSDPLSAITGGDYPQWTIDQLNAGGAATIQFTARIATTIGARVTLTNSAWGAYDSQPGANIDQRPYNIVTVTAALNTGEPVLDLVKSATPSPVNAGDTLLYTLAVTNTGLVTATGVVITDAVPANTTFASASDPHTLNAGVASWSIGTLGVGASALVTLAVNVNSPLFNNTSILNTAYVTSTEGITDSSVLNVPVNAAHTLALVKTASAEHVFVGRLLTYTLAYTISGNEQALGVTINDTVPPSVTYQACSGATCNEAAGLVTWLIGDVTPIGTGVVTLTVLINSAVPTGTLVVNRATITDSSGLQATSEVTVPVWSLPSFAITKTTEVTLAHANRSITYTILITNTGLGAATQTVITDELPISTTFGSCGPLPCTQVGSIVSWTIGTVMSAQSVAVTLAVMANSDVPSDTFLYNTHYGVTCAELPQTSGEPVILPTNVQLELLNARSADRPVEGNFLAGLMLTAAAVWIWDRRRQHR